MNQNLKILAVAMAIFFISMSFWMLVLDDNEEERLDLEKGLEYSQSNFLYTPSP